MNLTIEIPDDKTAALMAKATTLGVSAEQYIQRMVDRDLEQAPVPETGQAESGKPLAARIREIWADIPDEVRAKLPTDGASQHDHYIYGVPKRTP